MSSLRGMVQDPALLAFFFKYGLKIRLKIESSALVRKNIRPVGLQDTHSGTVWYPGSPSIIRGPEPERSKYVSRVHTPVSNPECSREDSITPVADKLLGVSV